MKPARPPAARRTAVRPTSRRRLAAVGLAVSALLVSGCGAQDDDPPDLNPPGTNVTVNGIAVRFAHLEDPDAPGTGYRAGDDVPLYLWLENGSSEEAELTGVSSAVAAEVTLEGAETPVELPVSTLVEMGPDDPHFVLQDVRTQIRGAEFVPVTLTFSDGTEVEMMVQAIEVGALD